MDLDLVRTLGRVIFGLFFVYLGLDHLVFSRARHVAEARARRVPQASAAALISGVVLVLGGLSIMLAYHMLIGAGLVALFLVAQIMLVTVSRAGASGMAAQRLGIATNLALFGAALFFMR